MLSRSHVFSVLFSVVSPCLGKRELVCMFLVHLFVHFVGIPLCLIFLFLLVSNVGYSGCDCGTRSLYFSLHFLANFISSQNPIGIYARELYRQIADALVFKFTTRLKRFSLCSFLDSVPSVFHLVLFDD